MFIPVGDSPNLAKKPWLTWTLIAINVAVYLALLPLSFELADRTDPDTAAYLDVLQRERGVEVPSLSEGDVVRFEWGFKPSAISSGSPFAPEAWLHAFTAMFLHGGLMHLLGNMLFLWIFGDNIEHRLGRFGFLMAYLGTGEVAAWGDALLRWGSSVPSVGASGAISGVLGLYFVFFPHNRVRVFVFLFPIFVNIVELSARFVLLVYLILNNIVPLLLTAGAGGVSYGAHIGGFIGGWALARYLATARPIGTAAGRSSTEGQGTLHERFRQALWTGQLKQASAFLFDLPRPVSRQALSAADKVALGDALSQAGHVRTALAAYQRALADHPTGRERVAAHLGAARIMLHGLGMPTAAYQHLYSAMEADPSEAEEQAARAMLADLRGGGVRTVPSARW